jgi:molybdate transport system substrate-binding protein
MKAKTKLAALLAALAVPIAAAQDGPRVFAAASLADAFREIGAAYEQAHPGEKVELNFAGSQVLRTQIEQGAGADVFASADPLDAESLRGKGLLGETAVFARNRLVVVVPKGSTRVLTLDALGAPGVKLVIAGPTVPAGRYAARVVAALGKDRGNDLAARIEQNVVSQETNVRAVLAKVALGEADAGFVYGTDAASSDKVSTLDIPENLNVVAQYPIGIVAGSARAAQAAAFVALVRGAEGAAILRRFGFTP